MVLIKNKEIIASFNLNYEPTSVSIGQNLNQIAVGGKVLTWLNFFFKYEKINHLITIKDNKVHIYQIDNNQFKETQSLQERDFVTSVRYSNNNEYLAVADNAKNVKCYKRKLVNKHVYKNREKKHDRAHVHVQNSIR